MAQKPTNVLFSEIEMSYMNDVYQLIFYVHFISFFSSYNLYFYFFYFHSISYNHHFSLELNIGLYLSSFCLHIITSPSCALCLVLAVMRKENLFNRWIMNEVHFPSLHSLARLPIRSVSLSNADHAWRIIRDSSSFHHFRDGLCSCRDYWWLPLDEIVTNLYYIHTRKHNSFRKYRSNQIT